MKSQQQSILDQIAEAQKNVRLMSARELRDQVPNPYEFCFCGSGLKFKFCCRKTQRQ